MVTSTVFSESFTKHETRHPRWWFWHPNQRRNQPQAQADAGNPWQANHLAYPHDFSARGINEFVICYGYKGYVINDTSLTTSCI